MRIDDNKVYNVSYANKHRLVDYGKLDGKSTKHLLAGYKFNGLFWSNPRTARIYMIEEV